MTDLIHMRQLAEKATPVEPRDLMAYEHGGGRLAVIRDGKRDLIADFYGDGADRDFYAAANPSAILAMIDRIEAMEKAIKDAVAEADDIGPTATHDTYGARRRLMLGTVKKLHQLGLALTTDPTN